MCGDWCPLAVGETDCIACVLFRPVHQMKATEFEFRHRALLNLVQIWLAFQVSETDKGFPISRIAVTPFARTNAQLLSIPFRTELIHCAA